MADSGEEVAGSGGREWAGQWRERMGGAVVESGEAVESGGEVARRS